MDLELKRIFVCGAFHGETAFTLILLLYVIYVIGSLYHPIRSREIFLQYNKMPNIVQQAIFVFDMDLTYSENNSGQKNFFFIEL